MARIALYLACLGASVALAACAAMKQSPAAPPAMRFQIEEGRNINSFVREGAVAAHLLLRAGTEPRILVAFPAGNSGVGVWFNNTSQPVVWTILREPTPLSDKDAEGRPLHGIETEVVINADKLDIREAVLSSVRVLRDYQALGTTPAGVSVAPTITGNSITWARSRLDQKPGYRLSIEALDGAGVSNQAITSGNKGRLHLKVIALTGETPLTPIDGTSLLTAAAARDVRARDVLTFLSYREKYLAGSWRFDTYFGRDTLMSLTLLAPVLQHLAIESGIGSVLSRLAPNGEVAHEEDIGEFAVLRNAREGRGSIDTPIYDYGMVDDDFMLAPVTANWLLENEGRVRAPDFLEARTPGGERHGDALVRNLLWIVERTAAFAVDPQPSNLVGIKAGRMTGQWRDSEEGLGRGRYAYDVNAVFVPAALDAVERLLDSGLLDSYLKDSQRRTLQRAGMQQRVWSSKAPPLFIVKLPREQASAKIESYAAAIGVDANKPLSSLHARSSSDALDSNALSPDAPPTSDSLQFNALPPDAAASGDSLQGNALSPDATSTSDSFEFNALSLDAAGKPIAVMHSDDGFALLFTSPTAEQLQRSIDAIMRPFPAGLLTPIGLLVANPAFADRETQARFGNDAYHGTVVWSWQQAVLAAGLSRQLARNDLPADLRTRLEKARSQLWASIDATKALRTSELWSWSFANGRYRAEPFGQHDTHADESNAAQLWSTVFLSFQKNDWLGADRAR